jgi:hypothetical protein
VDGVHSPGSTVTVRPTLTVPSIDGTPAAICPDMRANTNFSSGVVGAGTVLETENHWSVIDV